MHIREILLLQGLALLGKAQPTDPVPRIHGNDEVFRHEPNPAPDVDAFGFPLEHLLSSGIDKRDIVEEDPAEEEEAADEEEPAHEDGSFDEEDPAAKPLDGPLIDFDFLKPENLLREVYEDFPTQNGRKPKTFFTSFSTQLSYDDEDGWKHHHQSVYHEQRVTWAPEEPEATPTDAVEDKYNVEDDIQTAYEHEEDATPIPTRTRTKWRPRPGRNTVTPSETTTKPARLFGAKKTSTAEPSRETTAESDDEEDDTDEDEEEKKEEEAASTTTETVVKPTRRLFGVRKTSTNEATPTSTAENEDETEELQAEATVEDVASTTVVSSSTAESSPEPTATSTEGIENLVEAVVSPIVAPETTTESAPETTTESAPETTTESAPEPTAEAAEDAEALVVESASTTTTPESTVQTTSLSAAETSTAEPSIVSAELIPTTSTETVDEVETVTEQAVATTVTPEPTTEATIEATTLESTTAETTAVVPATTVEPTTTTTELSPSSSTVTPPAPIATAIKDKVAVIAGAVAAAINGAENAQPVRSVKRLPAADKELADILAHIPKDRPWDRTNGYPKLARAWRKKIQEEKERKGKHWKDVVEKEKEAWVNANVE